MIYRPEVDGLRAVAVAAVILFHAGVGLAGGGFVGVDVFFVISGFLITTIILDEVEQGRFSLASFYERRARRILPALFLVTIACIPAAWLLMVPDDLKDFAQSLVATTAFASNFLFWLESGYFDGAAELKPLLHTWSLAVEEQFYLVFPLFIMLAWSRRRRAIVLLVALAVASLVLAERWVVVRPEAAFYLFPSRAWELMVGAFAALVVRRQVVAGTSPVVREAAAWGGLGLIAWAILGYSGATPFPGMSALVPVLGTFLVIVFASTGTRAGRLLGSRPMIGLGLISYSAYLWHYPLFAFARHASLAEPPPRVFFALTVVGIGLAWISWRFVERPFRQRGTVSRSAIVVLALAGSGGIALAGAIGHLRQGFPERYPGSAAEFEGIARTFRDHALRSDCERRAGAPPSSPPVCEFGAPPDAASGAVALFGDSHAKALLPAFDAIGRSVGVTVHHVGLGGCPPLLGADVRKGNWAPGVCEALAARQLEFVRDRRPAKVFLAARWSHYTDGELGSGGPRGYFLVDGQDRGTSMSNARTVFTRSLESTIRRYAELGAEVVVIDQVPQHAVQPLKVYFRLSLMGLLGRPEAVATLDSVAIDRARHDALHRFSREATRGLAEKLGATTIDLDRPFCDAERCRFGDENRSLYRDNHHLNDAGALRVTGELRRAFRGEAGAARAASAGSPDRP